jgi:hypothetical protein
VLLLLALRVNSSGPRARLFVDRTSVHSSGGLGVYAGRAIASGEVATPYPGAVLSEAQHERLFAALTSNAERATRGEKALFSVTTLRLLHHFTVTGDTIDWPLLLNASESYRFGIPVNAPEEEPAFRFLIWMAFDGTSGRPIVDVGNASTVGLLINEPPNVQEFHNRVWGRMQRSEANVQARNRDDGVDLVAVRDIAPGEELLYCYGPLYFLRNYPIREEACPSHLWTTTG